jgi:hypothetical protein
LFYGDPGTFPASVPLNGVFSSRFGNEIQREQDHYFDLAFSRP